MPSDQNASTLKVRQPTDFLKLVSPLNFHLSYYRSENAENEPEKLKIPVAEPTDKRDNIFMIQGDDYLDRLEEKLTR